MESNYVDKNREEIVELLKSTKRSGMTNVITFLDKSDFFIREGSKRHHYYKGGLAEHSLGVFKKALVLNKNCDYNSLVICALLHDICNVSHKYTPHECFNGHGSRSVNLLQYLNLSLKDDERRAIRFHASIKDSFFFDAVQSDLEIAKGEELRNLIARCVQIDVSPTLSFIFPLISLAARVKNIFR